VIAVLALGAGACAQSSAAEAPQPAETSQAAAQPAQAATSPQRVLAMSDPGGTTLVDAEVRAAQKWVERLPRSSDKLVELGRAWVQKARHSADPGFYLNAKACAELSQQIDPKAWLAKELLSQVALNQHAFGEAQSIAEEVLAHDPESFVTLGVYSDTLLELGNVEEAMMAAERMVDFKPNLASYVRISWFQWLRGDLPAALGSAKLAIEAHADPGQPEPRAYALTQTATYFWHRGDYAGADAGYKKALSEHTDYPPALLGRAKVALAQGEPRVAIDLLRAADKQAPQVETAWRLGDACEAAGDRACAEAAFADVVHRGRREDGRTLAQFYGVKNRDAEEALRLTEKEMATRPGIWTQDARAWALYRAGRAAEAKPLAAAANRFHTPDAQLLYHHGAILIATGEKAAGAKLVKQALDLNPKFDPTAAAEASALLASTR
jgi:tetratricopeptide (TPR) repeat protein